MTEEDEKSSGPPVDSPGGVIDEEESLRLAEKLRAEDENLRQQDEDLMHATATIRMRLGDSYMGRGNASRAIGEYKRAVKMDGRNPRFLTRLADAYLYLEKVSEALSHYRRAIEADPSCTEARISLGDLYRRFGMVSEALAQ